MEPYGIIVRDVSCINLGFCPVFTKAIAATKIAEQQAKQAEFIVKKATQDPQAEINRPLMSSRSPTLAATNINSRTFATVSDAKM